MNDQQVIDFVAMLKKAPETQISKNIVNLMEEWSEIPSALQVLKTLDMMVHSGEASGFAITAIEAFLNILCKRENTSPEALYSQATWRQ